MFERVILGVDPGIAVTGLAVVSEAARRPSVAWAGTVRTPSGRREGARLRAIFDALRDALALHRPEAVALERLLWGKNVGSAMAVARASGVVLLAAEQAGVPLTEYAPLEVKMAVTGSGSASKEQIRTALTRLHAMEGVPSDPDAADAVAVAVCHLTRSRLDRVVSRA